MTDDLTTTWTELLAEHWDYGPTEHFDGWECGCGARILSGSEGDLDRAMHAHVAAVLVASSALKAHTDEAVEAVVGVAYEAVAAVGGSHSHWRQGGAGGVCRTCEQANERQGDLRARLDAAVRATTPEMDHA